MYSDLNVHIENVLPYDVIHAICHIWSISLIWLTLHDSYTMSHATMSNYQSYI